MAALVAYYLSELAPDRKKEIDSEDIQRYFEQADFPVVERPSKTLFDARNAGYLDAGASRGNFKLNSVGHDFVTHLPGSRVAAPVARPSHAAKPATVSKSAKTAARRIQPSRIENDV